MPIYVYERPDGSRFEIRQGFNDESLTADPETGVPVRRVLQLSPIIFKGAGWYKTDSRASASSDKPDAKAPEAATTTAEKSDGAATETKSAETKGAKEAASDVSAKTTEIKKTADKPATPAAAS